jgi:hypothetical protein
MAQLWEPRKSKEAGRQILKEEKQRRNSFSNG